MSGYCSVVSKTYSELSVSVSGVSIITADSVPMPIGQTVFLHMYALQRHDDSSLNGNKMCVCE